MWADVVRDEVFNDAVDILHRRTSMWVGKV